MDDAKDEFADDRTEANHVCGPECETQEDARDEDDPNTAIQIPASPDEAFSAPAATAASFTGRLTARMWYGAASELQRIGFEDSVAADIATNLTAIVIAHTFSAQKTATQSNQADVDSLNEFLKQILVNSKIDTPGN